MAPRSRPRPRPRPRKSLAIKLLIFLLLGAIVNVAVAWGSSLLIAPFGTESPAIGLRQNPHMSWELTLSDRGPLVLALSVRHAGPNKRPINHGPIPESLVPSWSTLAEPLPEFLALEAGANPNAYEMRMHLAAGWPKLSFAAESLRKVGEGDQLDVIKVNDHILLSSNTMPPTVLPLRPIWPGFAINTIFYAAVLWLVFAAPGMVKRRLRRVRGRCLHCGYDLRGQPFPEIGQSKRCPECGRDQSVDDSSKR